MVQMIAGKPLGTKSVMRALAALVTCGQECGGPGSSKDLRPGGDPPPIPKEGHSIYAVLTVRTHSATDS